MGISNFLWGHGWGVDHSFLGNLFLSLEVSNSFLLSTLFSNERNLLLSKLSLFSHSFIKILGGFSSLSNSNIGSLLELLGDLISLLLDSFNLRNLLLDLINLFVGILNINLSLFLSGLGSLLLSLEFSNLSLLVINFGLLGSSSGGDFSKFGSGGGDLLSISGIWDSLGSSTLLKSSNLGGKLVLDVLLFSLGFGVVLGNLGGRFDQFGGGVNSLLGLLLLELLSGNQLLVL